MNFRMQIALVSLLTLAACSDTDTGIDTEDMTTDFDTADMAADSALPDMSEDMTQTPPPYIAVTAGYRHSCLLRPDKTVTCFGLDNWGAASEVPAEEFDDVSAGTFLTCGILSADAHITCWGSLTREKGDFDPAQTYTRVRAGETHSCAVTTAGAVECNGVGPNGEADAAVTDAPTEGVFVDVTIGLHHSCALTDANTVQCWGDDTDSKVSDTPSGTFAEVVSGWHHGCARSAEGAVTCWGNADAIAGIPAGVFVDLSAELESTCGVLDTGEVRCWGKDNPQVADAPTDSDYVQVDVGTMHSCALKADGNVVCWGSDSEMQSTGTPTFPPPVLSGTLEIMGNAVCAMRSDNTPLCLGDGMQTARMGLILDAAEGSSYSVGYQHACSLDAAGAITCAGSFDGDGEVSGAPDGPFAQIGSGRYFNCALLTSGALSCWGRDDGEVVSTAPSGTFEMVSISSRSNVACALRDTGGLICWGDNAGGVADGEPAGTSFTHVDVGAEGDLACAVDDTGAQTCWGGDASSSATAPEATYVSTAVGYHHICGLDAANEVHCWGEGLLKTPLPPAGVKFADVMSDDDTSCGVTTMGDLWCFGSIHYTSNPENLH